MIRKQISLVCSKATSSVQFCTKVKPKPVAVQLDQEVEKLIENQDIKPKHHPGISKINCISIPKSISKSIIKACKDFPLKSLAADGEKLSRFLKARHPPLEQADFFKKRKQIYHELDELVPAQLNGKSDEERKSLLSDKTGQILKQKFYNWQQMVYDDFKSLQYVVGRGPAEYAILFRIMSEIQKRDAKFNPRSYFDFGSGVGTGIWVVSDLWKNSIYEYVLIDSSREMNELSDLILRGGDENRESSIKNVYHRQFLPASSPKFDLVLSAYSLLELP